MSTIETHRTPSATLSPRLAVHVFYRQWRWEYRWARSHGRGVREALAWSSGQVEHRRAR